MSEDDNGSYITEEERSSAVSDENHRNNTSGTTVGDGRFIDHNSRDHSPMFPIPENTHKLGDIAADQPPLTCSQLQAIKNLCLSVSDLCYNQLLFPHNKYTLMEQNK